MAARRGNIPATVRPHGLVVGVFESARGLHTLCSVTDGADVKQTALVVHVGGVVKVVANLSQRLDRLTQFIHLRLLGGDRQHAQGSTRGGGRTKESLEAVLEHQFAVCMEDWQMEQSGERKPAKWWQKSLVSMMFQLVPTWNWYSLAAAFSANDRW